MALVNPYDLSQYQCIVFDYGNVLIHPQNEADLARMAEVSKLPWDVLGPLYWAERDFYDQGVLTAEDYWGDMARKAGVTFSPAQLKHLIQADIDCWLHYDEAMYGFVRRLKASGKRLAVLSNMPRELGTYIKFDTDAFALFDHVTLSFETLTVKPQPEIYRHCLDGIGLPPEATLFLDDRLPNVEGARTLGMNAIHFTSREEVLPRLLAGK